MLKREMNIADFDPELWQAITDETARQEAHIELIASENYASPRVLQAQGSQLTNKYAEGYPHKRYYGGCEFVDIGEDIPPEQQNQPPIIPSITAPRNAEISSIVEITCIAEDPDGDELSYHWSSDNTTIEGEGATITWIAPEIPETYTITVRVTDNHGNSAIDSVSINVTDIPNKPPIVTGFIVTAPRPREEKTIDLPEELWMQPTIDARVLTPVRIECIAEDPDGDELTYSWEVTEGNITDEKDNSMVWIVPPNPVLQIITVTVADDRGGSTTAKLAIDVHCCK